MRDIPRKKFGCKIDVITEATIDIQTLIVSQMVSKLHAYEVVTEITQENNQKNKWVAFYSKVHDDEEVILRIKFLN